MIRIEDDRPALYQWDLNRRVALTNINPGIQVHFSHEKIIEGEYADKCPVLLSYEEDGKVYANIPNIFLQKNGIITVYIYVQDNEKAYTEYHAEILVLARPKPADYVYTETEVFKYETVLDIAEKAAEQAEAAKKRADNAYKLASEVDAIIKNVDFGVGREYGANAGEIFNDYDTNIASGKFSHAQGQTNVSSGTASHTQGHGNKAGGYSASAINRATEARGHGSFAAGQGTFASGADQFVIGTYNEIDKHNMTLGPDGKPINQTDASLMKKSKYAFIIGNGTVKVPANAMTVDWLGNVEANSFHGSMSGVSGRFDNLYITPPDGSEGLYDGYENYYRFVDKFMTSKHNYGNDIVVLKPTEAGTLQLEENTYYQFAGSSEKKTLTFYNSDNSVARSVTNQVITIQCGSMTDAAQFGVTQNMPTAMAFYVANDTGISAITTASTGCVGFKKNWPGEDRLNEIFRAEVSYPANSVIIIQRKCANPLPSIVK